MHKKLLLTFDYELFLGNRSGSIEQCLLTPTNKIIDVIDNYGAKGIFFVDTTYLLALRNKAEFFPPCKRDFETVTRQLQDLIKRGHYVYPHIHPHWLDAIYLVAKNEWSLNELSHYRFHNTPQSERETIFNGSIALLKELITPIQPDYTIDAYRAGGWCIQPFIDFKPFFEKHNIRNEFSVIGGSYLFSNVQYFDFTEAPEKPIYRFENDVTVENVNGQFTEFSISSIKISAQQKFINKILLKVLNRFYNDGSFSRGEGQIAYVFNNKIILPEKGYATNNSKYERIAIELLTAVKMSSYWNYFKQNDYIQFISHPKGVINHNIKMLEKFLNKAFAEYKVETDFKKMI